MHTPPKAPRARRRTAKAGTSKEAEKAEHVAETCEVLKWFLAAERRPRVPRLCELEAAMIPTTRWTELLRPAITKRAGTAKSLRRLRQSWLRWATWADQQSCDWASPTPAHLAMFLQDMAAGGPSVPGALRRALSWAAEVWHFHYDLADALPAAVAAEAANTASCNSRSARCATDDMIRHAEAVVGDETRCDRTRLVAGTCAALAHGCLRWSDLQRLTELRLTRTALAGRSWRIKNQGTRTRPWAAVRVGISGDDWAAPFVALRDEVLRGHPDADWCPPRPDGDDLLPGLPATYADALLAMRRLLTEPPLSLDWTEACTFSLHSWRHWLPTATNQLNVAKEDRCTVGHWSANSAMPDRCDAAACVRELAVKSAVVAAYRRGWRRVGDFEIPLPEPMPPAGSAPAGSVPAAGDMAPPAEP